MKKKIANILSCLALVTMLILVNSNVYAGFYEDAKTWFDAGSLNETMNSAVSGVKSDIENYIEILGTAIIVIATIVLGLRYIFASADGKAAAKESTMNLLVACLLFFGWSTISNLLYDGKDFVLYKDANSFDDAVKLGFAIFKFVAEAVALVGILYFGVKYIFAGAEGKAEFKKKSFPFVIGIILTFSAFEVLNIISKLVNLQ